MRYVIFPLLISAQWLSVELLTQMSSDQVTIALGGELDQGLLRPLTGDD
jgi:hypothetical protein